jgi:chemosensory pili system protein ChpA (sensor histidine kinase/response regulator)
MSANPNLLSSLHWVQGELAQSLTRVRTLVETHMESSPDNQLPLQQAVVELHQVRGTASMIQCAGIVALTDEMKFTLQDMLQGRIAEPEPAYAALLGATVQLGDYIDALSSGLEDSVLVFQPAINEMRLSRGRPVLSEADLFAEQLAASQTAVAVPPGDARTPGSAQAGARKFQLVFQQNLVQWMKGQDAQLAIGRLGKVAEQIAAAATLAPVYLLWRCVAAVAEALLTKGIEDSGDVKRLFGRVAAQLKALAEQGEEAAAKSAGALPYQCLYFVARSRSQGPRVTTLRTAFPMARLLPTAESLDQLRQKIRGPNTTLLQKLSEEIRKDLNQVKDNIDLVVRAGDKAPTELNSTVEKLNRVAVTLSMLNLGPLQAVIQSQARVLAGVNPRSTPPTAPVWLDVATALLRVEHTLDDALYRQLRRARTDDGAEPPALDQGIPDFDVREGREALLRETLIDLAKLKSQVDTYLKVGDATSLGEGGKLLGNVETAMHMLNNERAALLTAQLRGYLGSPSFGGVRVERAQAERFADAIAAIEYYLESLQSRSPDADRAVDNLVTAVERLELGHAVDAPGPVAPSAGPPPPPPSMAQDDVDPEIRDIFLEEASEVLGTLKDNLPVVRRDTHDREAWTEVRRSFHTLKGSGRMVGARDIGEFAWSVENLLNRCLEGTHAFDPPVVELVDQAVGVLPGLIDGFRNRQPAAPAVMELQNRAHRMAKGDDAGGPDAGVVQAFCNDARERLAQVRTWLHEQDHGKPDFPVDEEVLRSVHTLAGSAALVSAQGIAGLCRELENYLNALRASKMRLPHAGLQLLVDGEPQLGEWVERLARGSVAEPDLKPWLRRLNEVQAALPKGSLDAATQEASAEQFAHEAFSRLEDIEKVFRAWREHPRSDFHPTELPPKFHMLRGDAVTAGCVPLGHVADAFSARVKELMADKFVPDHGFFRDVAALIEGMYCFLDDFREHKLVDDGASLVARAQALGTVSAAGTEVAEGVAPAAAAPPPVAPVREPPPSVAQAPVVERAAPLMAPEAEQEPVPEPEPAPEPEASLPEAIPEATESEFEETLEAVPVESEPEPEPEPEPSAPEPTPEADEEQFVETVEVSAVGIDMPPFDGAPAPAAAEAAVDPELVSIFLAEADELLEILDRQFALLERDPRGKEPLAELARALHTLKGGARMAGLDPVGDVSHRFESLLEQVASGAVRRDAALHAQIGNVMDGLYRMIDEAKRGRMPDATPVLNELEAGAPAVDPEVLSIFITSSTETLQQIDQLFDAWEREPYSTPVVQQLARAVHALKGNANTAGFPSMGQVAHQIKQLFDRIAEGRVARDAVLYGRLHNCMDALHSMLEQIGRGEAPDPGPALAELEGVVIAPTAPPPAQPMDVAAIAPVAPALPEPVTPLIAEPLPPGYDPDLTQIFAAEAGELLESLAPALTAWQQDARNEEALREMQRALHTLKGGARTAGMLAMGTVAHEMESRVDEIAESRAPVDAAALAALHSDLEQLQRMQDRLIRGEGAKLFAESLGRSLQAAGPEPVPTPSPRVEEYREPAAPAPEPAPVAVGPAALAAVMAAQPQEAPAPAAPKSPWDPGLFWKPDDPRDGMAARQRETARVAVEQLDKMLNEAGEISIYRARLEQHNNALQFQLNEMQQTLERVRDHLRGLDIETETQIAARGFSQGLDVDRDKRADFDPLEMDRFSRMQELSRTLSESIGDLSALRATMDDQLSEADTLLMQQGRVNTEVQQGLMATLMVPFSRQVQRLQRVVKQTAQETGKLAEVRFDGIEQELDRNVLERMVAPLEHLLRNSVVHGIEQPARRQAAGKPESGTIQVNLHREGTQLVIEVRDDGKGLDYAAIRKTAIERGVMAPDAKLRDQEVAMFIFEAGFSTAKEVTQAAGRGVGMDVVASEVKQLGGTLELSSEVGKGARFMIRLPLTLAMSQTLLVGVAGEVYAIPLPSIESITRVPRDKLGDYLREDGPEFIHGGQEYRVRSLAEMLETPNYKIPDGVKSLPAVLVRLGEGLTGAERRVALLVDTLFGNREIVSKAVGPQVSAVQGVSGATILPDGRVVLIIDAPALVTNRARRIAVEAVQADQVAATPLSDERATIMVVDDSITIRRVTQRLLERAGFRVVLAKDGLDAMAQLQTETPATMLLDIEMPRADGFEVAAFVRNSERLKDLPIIMITSRSGEKHRDRARQIGVNRYVIKPYQEEQLLSEVRAMLELRP